MGKSKYLGAALAALLVLSSCAQEPADLVVETEATATASPTAASVPEVAVGDKCSKIGEQQQLAQALVICRMHSDEKGYWVKLTGSDEFPGQIAAAALEQVALDVEMCKIRDQRARNQRGGGSIAFPRSEERIPASGVVNVAIVPIDYPDAPGSKTPSEWIQKSIDKVDAWTEFFTDGRLKYNWIITDDWITMPKDAKWYVWDHPTIVDGEYVMGDRQLQSDYDQAYEVFSAADEYFELEDIDFAWVFSYPGAMEVDWAPGYGMNERVPTKSGVYDFSYYSIGTFLFGSDRSNSHNRPLWVTLLHEMGHAHGIAGHAPGNGWSYDVMASGSTLSAWNGWIVDWIPDEEFVCLDGGVEATHTVVLDSVDLNRGGTIAAVVRLSDREVLVIESRRKGPFSFDFPDGLAAITATYVNSATVYQRYDSNYAREKDYFSFFARAEGADREFTLGPPGLGDENLLGYLGDTLVFENVRVLLKESAEFDTIQIQVGPKG